MTHLMAMAATICLMAVLAMTGWMLARTLTRSSAVPVATCPTRGGSYDFVDRGSCTGMVTYDAPLGPCGVQPCHRNGFGCCHRGDVPINVEIGGAALPALSL